MRILIVEDHADSAAMLARLLRGGGHEVDTALDAATARALAASAPFDLVLCDLTLPDGDGCELMRWLHRTYGLRGLALTGDGDAPAPTDAGFLGRLTKPVDLPALLDLLGKLPR